MPMPTVEILKFTPEELYERVWSLPATKLAAELGCSDVMLGKACRSHYVPKPYLGYRAKLEHGKKPRRTPLPKNDDPRLQTIVFHKYPPAPDGPSRTAQPPEPEPALNEDVEALLEKHRRLGLLVVAEQVRRLHPLVAATRDALRRRKIDERYPSYRRPYSPSPSGAEARLIEVDVSRGAIPRAVRILDALARRLERLGGGLEPRREGWRDAHKWPEHGPWTGGSYFRRPSEGKAGTFVAIAGETVIRFRLRERRRRVKAPPSKSDDIFDYGPSHVYEPTGILAFDSGGSWSGDVLLADSANGKTRLEDGLDELVAGWIRTAGRLRAGRHEEVEARERWEEEARLRREREEDLRRRREDLARRQAAEQARVDELLRGARAWREARLVREYLAAVAEAADAGGAESGEAAALAEHLHWAREQADRLDPLTPSPPSVLDERV